MKTLGFIGLGNMGGGMVKNLLSAGFGVLVFDIDEEKTASLEALGAQKAKNVTKIAKSCPIILLCLPNPDTSKEVLFNQLAGASKDDTTFIETSTLTPEIVTDFAKQFNRLEKQFLSAPMVGGKNHAANGSIEFLVEGDEVLYKENLRIFDAMGKGRYMGNIPSATLAKLTFNLCRYANIAVAVEAYRMLRKYNANTAAIHEFMSEQSLDNFGQVWAEDMKGMMTQDVPFKPSQVPKKDLALLSEMAKAHGIDQKLIDTIRDTYLSME